MTSFALEEVMVGAGSLGSESLSCVALGTTSRTDVASGGWVLQNLHYQDGSYFRKRVPGSSLFPSIEVHHKPVVSRTATPQSRMLMTSFHSSSSPSVLGMNHNAMQNINSAKHRDIPANAAVLPKDRHICSMQGPLKDRRQLRLTSFQDDPFWSVYDLKAKEHSLEVHTAKLNKVKARLDEVIKELEREKEIQEAGERKANEAERKEEKLPPEELGRAAGYDEEGAEAVEQVAASLKKSQELEEEKALLEIQKMEEENLVTAVKDALLVRQRSLMQASRRKMRDLQSIEY